jgi:predicted phosphodiesterase
MRLALISDTHFGDPLCTLITTTDSGRLVPGRHYKDFVRAAGRGNDYLILLGDILDFAIQSYSRAYEVAKAFFLMAQRDNVAKQMIYVPGNHDGDIWHVVEHQVNIIHQIEQRRLPREFRMSLPGVIDARRRGRRGRLLIPGVSEKRLGGRLGYGGLFLDALTAAQGRPTRFNFTYPNLYFVSDEGSVLLTHGHYLERYWVFASEWGPALVGPDLGVSDPMLLREMVALNFPLTQLACSGVGQAGPLTRIIYGIQSDIASKRLARVERYLARGERYVLQKHFGGGGIGLRRSLAKLGSRWARSSLIRFLRGLQSSRYNADFMNDGDVRTRFADFYMRSCREIEDLNREHGLDLPMPASVIFGHTHQPVPWNSHAAPVLAMPGGNSVRLFNAGGWLGRILPDGREQFCGAEVFRFDSAEGWSSASIR